MWLVVHAPPVGGRVLLAQKGPQLGRWLLRQGRDAIKPLVQGKESAGVARLPGLPQLIEVEAG